ncbi:MAG: Hsp20/alpha crystallin family protein [Acidiphilium sp.]|nr:Hsp20/alpha crystallin family protein [Acidiphilium sp.]MDD4936712.1 Hsp20/alpha crystallin family protein [Acidiphilium sp.]
MNDTQIEVKKPSATAASPTPSPAISPSINLWKSFRSEFDSLFDRFSLGLGAFPLFRGIDADRPSLTSYFAAQVPCIDISESEKNFTITAELPGLTEKDVEVSTNGSVLTIKGEKQQESERTDKNYYLSERSYGSFERHLTLPEGVDPDHIEATVAKGVLTVNLPKTEAAQAATKKIDVKAA